MEKFSKAELQWIQAAVWGEQDRLEKFLSENTDEPIIPAIVKLRMEGLEVVSQKLEKIIKEGHKRIAIN